MYSFDGAIWIIEEIMGDWHAYYAKHSAAAGGEGIVAIVDGRPAGGLVYYQVDLGGAALGVIYYVAVRPEHRGGGIGKILVLSAEELMDVDLYVATLQSSNTSSRRMFSSICYREYTWDKLTAISRRLAEVIYRATCSYEDDIVMIKGSVEEVGLSRGALRKARSVWDKICYKPWLMKRGVT